MSTKKVKSILKKVKTTLSDKIAADRADCVNPTKPVAFYTGKDKEILSAFEQAKK